MEVEANPNPSKLTPQFQQNMGYLYKSETGLTNLEMGSCQTL